MTFDDTYTDREFERALSAANQDLFNLDRPVEPDLSVEGLKGSLMSRLAVLFNGKQRS